MAKPGDGGWNVAEPPVIAYGPFSPAADFFTVLLFTLESNLGLDGQSLAGRPYLGSIWEPTIGGKRSSRLIALNEMLLEPKSQGIQ